MRVSQSMLRLGAHRDLTLAREALYEKQIEASSGLKVRRFSDDPVAAASILRSKIMEAGVEQQDRNRIAARSRMTVEEQVLSDLQEIIMNARDIAASEGSGQRNATTRQAASYLVDQMLTHVLSLGNSTVGGAYVFAGQSTDSPAFDPAGNYLGDLNSWDIEVAQGHMMTPSYNGDQIFVGTGLIQAMRDLYTGLQANDPTAILTAYTDLKTAFDNVSAYQADVGGRQQIVDALETAEQDQAHNALVQRTNLEAADMAITLSDLQTLKTAYEAALGSVRVGLQMNITSLI